MILFTFLMIMLLAMFISLLIGGVGIAIVFGDVIICTGIIMLIVKLFKKNKKGKS